MPRRTVALIVIPLLALVSACGGSSSGGKTSVADTPAPTATSVPDVPGVEDPFAKGMLLTAADFPAGYLETSATSGQSSGPNSVNCALDVEKDRTGHVVGSAFAAAQDAPSITETILIFPTEAAASASMDAVPAFVDCAVKAINDGKLNKADVALFNGVSATIDIVAPGDSSHAYIVKADGLATGGTTSGGTLIFTLVFARVGRIEYQINVTGNNQLLDPAEVATYAQKAHAKIRQQP